MKKIERILVALDFGATTLIAVERTRQLAARLKAEVIPVHVVEAVSDYPFFHVDAMELINDTTHNNTEDSRGEALTLEHTIKHTNGTPITKANG